MMKNLFKKVIPLSAVLLISTMSCLSAFAEDKNIVPVYNLKGGLKAEEAKPSILKGWVQGNYATGDWLGARTKLEDKGIYLNTTYTIDAATKTRGGIGNRRGSAGMYYGNSSILLDSEKMGLWKGGSACVNMQYLRGTNLSPSYIGDIQGYNNNGAPKYVMLHEYWLKQSLFKGQVEIKGGKQNANVEFMGLPSTANFMNLSFGVIANSKMPNSPNTALGIATKYSPSKYVDLRYGMFDGDARVGRSGFNTAFDKKGGSYHIAEITLKPEVKGHEGVYKFGGWYHTANATVIGQNNTYGGNEGIYLAATQNVFHEKGDKTQGLDIFGQFGSAPEDINQIDQYYGFGARYKGLIPKRNQDETGVGTGIAHFSSRSKTLNNQTKETAVEVYHKIQLTPWLAIQPDLQVIIRPNGNEKSTTVFGLRSIISF
ncbi:MAG: carbohydrate porin [bacterium]